MSTPTLWSSLHISVPGGSEEAELLRLRHDAASEWLSRSGALPLSISMSEPTTGDLFKQKQSATILKMLFSFSTRWCYIDFSPLTSRSLLEDLRVKHVPMLRSIAIQNRQGIKSISTWDALEFLHAPEIRAFAFNQMPGDILKYRLRWEQLTELRIQPNKIQPLSPHEGLLLLRRCPNLVNCWLEITLAGLIPTNIRSVTLPFLKTLGIEQHELATDPPFSVFHYLLTPALHTLEFYRLNARGDPTPAFFAYLSQLTCLRSLSLDVRGFSDTALVQCFQSAPPGLTGLFIPERNHRIIESPHLRTILERSYFTDRILALLTPGPECLLPELEVFECAQGIFSETSLIKFIQGRNGNDPNGKAAHLKRVNVIFPFQQTRDIAYELSGSGGVGYGMELVIDYYIKTAGFFQPHRSSPYSGLPLPGRGNATSTGDAGCEVPSLQLNLGSPL